MTDLPEINSLLYITLGDANLRSRVEDVDGPLLSIGAPIGAGELDVPDDDSELEVFWTGVRARYVMPVRMIGRTRTRPARWHLLALGEPMRQTRRGYVRGGGGGAVELHEAEDTTPGPTTIAQIIDISEAGLRCQIPDVGIELGGQVVLRLHLPNRLMEVSGTIRSIRSGENGPDTELVMTYTPKEPDARAIRQYVFQWEITERRRRLGLG
jgi:hypothetical protein